MVSIKTFEYNHGNNNRLGLNFYNLIFVVIFLNVITHTHTQAGAVKILNPTQITHFSEKMKIKTPWINFTLADTQNAHHHGYYSFFVLGWIDISNNGKKK